MQDPVVGIQYERTKAAAERLCRDGYAVIPGVVSPADCARLESLLWDAVESVTSKQATPVLRNDPSTHRGDTFLPVMHGIITEPCELSHCAAAWEARKAAAPYFAHLHGTRQLLASFDRINMMPAPGNRAPVLRNWMHTDQTPLLDGLHSIQGFIDLKGTGPDDGGLIVADKSHLAHHQLLLGEFGITADTKNWVRFSAEQRAVIEERFALTKVLCEPGSLVLWDSRVFHENNPPRPGGHDRKVIYTSFQPRSAVPDKNRAATLKKRVTAFQEMRSTSHVALSHFKVNPRTGKGQNYGKPVRTYHIDKSALGVPAITGPNRDPIVAALVGEPDAAAEVVNWVTHAPERGVRRALLSEKMLSPEIMVATRPVLLAKIEAAKKATLKRKRADEYDDADLEAAAFLPPAKRQRVPLDAEGAEDADTYF